MKSCRTLVLSLCAVAVVGLVGCVPYETHENLQYDFNRLSKSYNDLRAKYNRLLAELERGGGTIDKSRLAELREQLDLKAEQVSDLQKQVAELKALAFDKDDAVASGAQLDSSGGLVLDDSILFNSGSADLKPSGRRSLDGLAGQLKTKYDGETFHLIGHTDTDPILKARGMETNINLGFRRAYTVFKYLSTEHHIPEQSFILTSKGYIDPKAPNDTDQNKARNRRVEIYRLGAKV